MVQIIKNSILPFVIAACAVAPAPAAPLVRTATRPVMQALKKASVVVGKQVKTSPYIAGLLATTAASTIYVTHQLGKHERHVAKLERAYNTLVKHNAALDRTTQKKKELDAARKGLYFTRGTSYRVAQERFAERYNKSEIAFQEFLKQNPHCAAHLMSVFAFLASLAVSGAAPAGLYSAGKLCNSTKLIKNAQDFSLKMIKPNSILLATFFAATITAKIKIWLDERDRAFRNDDGLLTPEEEQAQAEEYAAQEKAEQEAEAHARLRDYYEELGVAKNASTKQIKAAYQRLALELHPDRNPGNERVAEAKFKRLNHAYAILVNARHRIEYDLLGFEAERLRDIKRQQEAHAAAEREAKDASEQENLQNEDELLDDHDQDNKQLIVAQ